MEKLSRIILINWVQKGPEEKWDLKKKKKKSLKIEGILLTLGFFLREKEREKAKE